MKANHLMSGRCFLYAFRRVRMSKRKDVLGKWLVHLELLIILSTHVKRIERHMQIGFSVALISDRCSSLK